MEHNKHTKLAYHRELIDLAILLRYAILLEGSTQMGTIQLRCQSTVVSTEVLIEYWSSVHKGSIEGWSRVSKEALGYWSTLDHGRL